MRLVANIIICTLFVILCSCHKDNINDYIKSTYGLHLPFYVKSTNVIKQNSDYIIVKLTNNEIEQLLALTLPSSEYTQWEKFSDVGIFLSDLEISGDYIFCKKKYMGPTQFSGIFVQKSKKEVIFLKLEW